MSETPEDEAPEEEKHKHKDEKEKLSLNGAAAAVAHDDEMPRVEAEATYTDQKH